MPITAQATTGPSRRLTASVTRAVRCLAPRHCQVAYRCTPAGRGPGVSGFKSPRKLWAERFTRWALRRRRRASAGRELNDLNAESSSHAAAPAWCLVGAPRATMSPRAGAPHGATERVGLVHADGKWRSRHAIAALGRVRERRYRDSRDRIGANIVQRITHAAGRRR